MVVIMVVSVVVRVIMLVVDRLIIIIIIVNSFIVTMRVSSMAGALLASMRVATLSRVKNLDIDQIED